MIGLPATVALDTVLRFATPEDAPAISALVRTRAAELGYGTPTEFEEWFDTRYTVNKIVDRIGNQYCRDLVVIERDRLIGSAYVDLNTGYLGGLHVASDAQGIGTLLIVARIELAREAGQTKVWMGVNSSNKRMVDYAIRQGFTFAGTGTGLVLDWPFATTESFRWEMQLRRWVE